MRSMLVFGDKSGIKCVDVTHVDKDGKFVIVIGKEIEERIDIPYEVKYIESPYDNSNGRYFYYFNNILDLNSVMRYIGFEYKEGVSCVDGVFIEQSETKKSFFDSLPNKSYVHTLINVDKSYG